MSTELRPGFSRGYDDPAYRTCPNEANHTPHPIAYGASQAWMTQMQKTHKQTRCPDCGRWAIWIPKPTRQQVEAQRDPL